MRSSFPIPEGQQRMQSDTYQLGGDHCKRWTARRQLPISNGYKSPGMARRVLLSEACKGLPSEKAALTVRAAGDGQSSSDKVRAFLDAGG